MIRRIIKVRVNNRYKIGDNVTLYKGDCIETMRTLPDNSVDAIVTDPPYELGFMNKSWDSTGIANSVEMWKECLRILKPGGHLLSFGGTRTYHRMTCAIEDAGFEIRDQMQWLYGSGFPKSMNIGKAIKAYLNTGGSSPKNLRKSRMGENYEPTGQVDYRKGRMFSSEIVNDTTAEIINNEWEGWGTCLKPANEPICLARKPISEKTIAENVLKWGTGGLNIDACRIGYSINNPPIPQLAQGKTEIHSSRVMYGGSSYNESSTKCAIGGSLDGRFPANIILDEEAGELLDAQSGITKSAGGRANNALRSNQRIYGKGVDNTELRDPGLGDVGGASRFFYCAKTSKSERNAGLNGMEKKAAGSLNFRNPSASGRSENAPSVAAMGGITKSQENHHPTVKPVKLMEYLIKLITPPGGVVLDPFMGSGSTGIAAKNLGFGFIGIEKEKEYCEIAQKRITFGKESE